MTRTEPISYVEATIRALEEDNAELLAEIERLRAANKTLGVENDCMAASLRAATADNERLRELNAQYLTALEPFAAMASRHPSASPNIEMPLGGSFERVDGERLFFASFIKARAALGGDND